MFVKRIDMLRLKDPAASLREPAALPFLLCCCRSGALVPGIGEDEESDGLEEPLRFGDSIAFFCEESPGYVFCQVTR